MLALKLLDRVEVSQERIKNVWVEVGAGRPFHPAKLGVDADTGKLRRIRKWSKYTVETHMFSDCNDPFDSILKSNPKTQIWEWPCFDDIFQHDRISKKSI